MKLRKLCVFFYVQIDLSVLGLKKSVKFMVLHNSMLVHYRTTRKGISICSNASLKSLNYQPFKIIIFILSNSLSKSQARTSMIIIKLFIKKRWNFRKCRKKTRLLLKEITVSWNGFWCISFLKLSRHHGN